AGGQEHAESFGADESEGGGEGAVQEDCPGSRGGGPAAGGGVSGVLCGSAAGDCSRSGRHRRSALWAPGRAILSRLLWGLLLSAPLYLLRRRAAVCALAAIEYRCVSGLRGGIGAHREADPGSLAGGEDHPSGRLGVLPGRADEVVRRSGGRLCAGVGEERPAEGGDRQPTGASGSRVWADGESGTGVQGVQLSDAGQLVAGAEGGGQGGAFGEGRQPALCGDVVGAGSLGSAPFVRRVILRAGRDGEPN